MLNNLLLIVFKIVLFLTKLHNTTCLSSYIYLPDKLINEEIPIGSQILDLIDELNSYFNKIETNSIDTSSILVNGLTQTQLKSIIELKTQIKSQQYTFLEDIKQQASDQTYFLLDSITGRITTKRYLDRESMCLNKHCMDICDSTINNNQQFIANNTLNTQRNNVNNGNCRMNLKILLIPSYNIISLNVIIQDINDNKPQFQIDVLNQTIPENVPIGHKIPIDLAYDADTGINSVQYYKLINLEINPDYNKTTNKPSVKNKLINANERSSIDDPFELIQNLNEIQLALVVRKKLDREIKSSYHYLIIAYDGGEPISYTGQLEVYLTITDINDNNPKFKQDVYIFSVNENVVVGTQIGRIEAFDLDEGLNGQIKYSLVSGINGGGGVNNGLNAINVINNDSIQDDLKYFDLNESNGVLTLKHELDYEIEQYYSLTVEAKDCGVGSLPAYAQIEIFVLDANDNAPEISVSFLNNLFKNNTKNSTQLNVYISESMGENKYLAHVSVFDKDSLNNGAIDWKVFVNDKDVSNEQANLILINRLNNNSFTINTGVVSKLKLSNDVKTSLYDRELFDSFNVSIYAWDFGKPISKSTYFNFTVRLLDENDNKPIFENNEYSFTFFENNAIGYQIGYLVARDSDINENGRVTYKIRDAFYEKYFKIDANTGLLQAVKSLDREEIAQYKFYVDAVDNGKPPLSGSTLVKIDLIDLNDNSPKILFNTTYLNNAQLPNKDNTLILRLDEDLAIDTLISKFYASDPDEGENGKVKFVMKKLLKHEHDANGQHVENKGQLIDKQLPFKLLSNGELRLINKLDRERFDKYEMIIQCYDLGIKPKSLTSELNVLIYINDVNDNCPHAINDTKLHTYFNRDELFSKQNFLSDVNKQALIEKYILFETTYTDADLGVNSELKFDLLSYQELFQLNDSLLRLKPNQLKYKIEIKLKRGLINIINSTLSAGNSIEKLNTIFKLGKYVVKLRISDKGETSCSIIENYILYVGDSTYKSKDEVLMAIDRNEQQLRLQPPDTLIKTKLFINDDENDNLNETDILDQEKSMQNNKVVNNHLRSKSTENTKFRFKQFSKFTQNDYLLLIAIISMIIIIAIFFSLIGTVYFYNRYNKKCKKTVNKVNSASISVNGISANISGSSSLKTSNTLAITSNDDSIEKDNLLNSSHYDNSVNSSKTYNDDTSNDTITATVTSNSYNTQQRNNNKFQLNGEILYNNIDNRFSLSNKSTDTEQSNSADSILSSTYTKDTKTSSSLNSTSDQHQNQLHVPNVIKYTSPTSNTSTFLRHNHVSKSFNKAIVSNQISNVNKFLSNTLDTRINNNNNNSNLNKKTYKSILKDTTGSNGCNSYSGFNTVSRVHCAYNKAIFKSPHKNNDGLTGANRYFNNYNCQMDANIDADSTETDTIEESTAFLTAKVKNQNEYHQYDYKSSAV